MSTLARGTRLVSFRVTDGEWAALEHARIAHGARSVAGFSHWLTTLAISGESQPLWGTSDRKDPEFLNLRRTMMDLCKRLDELAAEVRQSRELADRGRPDIGPALGDTVCGSSE